MKKFFLGFLLAGTLNLFASDIIIKKSPCDVYMTSHILEKIIMKRDMNIFAKINHSANAKNMGMALDDSLELIFGKAQIATRLMQQDMLVGLDLPLRILIYKDKDGIVKVAYRDGSWLKQKHIIDAPKLINKINNGLDKITNKAIAECRK